MSQPSVKLTMIGPSGTGKSCYLYATYFRMLEGVAGFNFNCKDYSQARELASAWDVILDEGVWPSGTAESEEYRFACKKDGASIGEFSWLDYRGGLLNDTGGSRHEVDSFLARASSSDAILACVPADAILAARPGSGKRSNDWQRIKVGLLGALAAIYETTTAIDETTTAIDETTTAIYETTTETTDPALIFLITKSDLCKSPEDGRYCVETIRSSFAQYFNGKPKYAMVASTRMGRFDDERADFQQGEPINGVVDPTNVHLPILFPFWRRAKDAQEGGVAQARENRDAAERKHNEAQEQLEAARVEKEKAEEKWNAVKKRAKRFFIFAPILLALAGVCLIGSFECLYDRYVDLSHYYEYEGYENNWRMANSKVAFRAFCCLAPLLYVFTAALGWLFNGKKINWWLALV
ncbi:MAG: hypothetical protein IJZ10_00405, partial [Thermoguttaceae bacterium]|nr:hypothetical protein [Thermoguttaceae bacterium]